MAGDKKQFELALKWRNEIVTDKAISVPAETGKVAILCAHPRGGFEKEKNNKTERDDARTFRKEALALATLYKQVGKDTDIVFRPTFNDFDSVVRDPNISDIVTIGHGCLSAFYLDSEDTDCIEEYDWYDAISHADHLKTGAFIQRHCGHFARSLNVPIGTFIVQETEQVFAPAGHYMSGRGLYHSDELHMQQPIADAALVYDYFKEKFPRQTT